MSKRKTPDLLNDLPGSEICELQQQNNLTNISKQKADEVSKVVITMQEILHQNMEALPLKVYNIDLHQRNISEIPFVLKEFTKLRSLDLSCNAIEEIKNIFANKELRELKLYDNQIKLICNLNDQKELLSLQLQHNQVVKIGTGLSPLRKLNYLRMDNNRLSSVEVKELAPLSALTTLDLSFNQLKDITAIVCLYNIEELFVSNNSLESIPDFSRCKKLKELDISKNRLKDIGNLRGALGLQKLDFSCNFIESIPSFLKFVKLLELNVSGNLLNNFNWLSEICPAVECLDISENKVVKIHSELKATLLTLKQLYEFFFTNCNTLVNVISKWFPQLQMYNGVPLNRPQSSSQSRPMTPLMRPMSAAATLSVRAVESQMKNMDATTNPLEDKTEKAFNDLMSRLEDLSTHTDKIELTLAEMKEERLHSPSSNRVTDISRSRHNTPQESSRSTGRHSRLRQALEYSRQSEVCDDNE